MNRIIAIGDIHGCHLALEALVDALAPTADDVVVTLGDYTDRGTGSRQVIDMLLDLSAQTQLVPILGNHDQMFLESARGNANAKWNWLMNGGQRTLESYGTEDPSGVPKDHLVFLDDCLDYYETDKFIFVHGSLQPEDDLDDQDWKRWRWMHLRPGNPCEHRGHKSGKHMVCGHTPQLEGEPLSLPWLTCLDTGCCFGGWLTGMDVLTGDYWQFDRFGKARE